MRYYIQPLKLQLARTWIYDDKTRSCCRVAVKFGLYSRTRGITMPMTPGEASREQNYMQSTFYRNGYWPLWFFVLCCGAYVLMTVYLISYLINR